jgi:nickel-dependent lactate racemase
MMGIAVKSADDRGLDGREVRSALVKALEKRKGSLSKVLLLPPDFTRAHSGAGEITAVLYDMLKDTCQVDIMPALGTHMPMSDEERIAFFGEEIPKERFFVHNWRDDVVKIGEIPADFIREISEGLMAEPIDVEVNRRLIEGGYDLIISIGQVVPHEVVGMANYSKNVFVGCGGQKMINQTHMLGAIYGMERIMGRDHSPVRKVFDYAEEHFARDLPLMYILTVTTHQDDRVLIHGLFIGRERRLFEEAVALSQEKNMQFLDEPLDKVVVFLDPQEFKSTWLGNKAIYRTRMAIADGGELIVLAPGVRQFGEDRDNDRLIRKYGYIGRERVLKLFREQVDLQQNQSVAAHLIHGSSDGRFTITYAPGHLNREEVEGVNFKYMDLEQAYSMYDPKKLKDGFNVLDNGERIFYISNPALGLWAYRGRFH